MPRGLGREEIVREIHLFLQCVVSEGELEVRNALVICHRKVMLGGALRLI